MTLKVYHVILHRSEDLDVFYADMESPGGSLYIPERDVDYAARLPFSKVTAYRLTDEEAELVRQDPRVKAVEPALEEHNIVAEPFWEQTATFRKDLNDSAGGLGISNAVRNWALYQCTRDTVDTTFGVNGTVDKSATVTVNSEGLNVDVIVVDGTPNLDHPEFAVNADGTGGSRIIQYNWFQHTDSVTGGLYSNGAWDYTTNSLGDSSNNNHGTHVMGTIVGNTQGWARKANVYSISPYSSNYNWTTSGVSSSYVLDYVRAFHRNKPINPATGRKNPTIINNSWGYSYNVVAEFPWANGDSDIEKIVYRGTTYNAPFTDEQIYNFGIPAWWALTKAFRDAGLSLNDRTGIPDAYTGSVPWFFQSTATKTQECIDDGIIVVSAAGNNSTYIDSENGPDYNNHVIVRNKRYGSLRAAYQGGDSAVYYNKGSAPANTSICVGNASIYTNNQRDFSSNFGPRTDIFAPGNEILSAIRFNGVYDNETTDSRNASYYLGQISGTSMASPQVAGVLACALENNPDMNQADALAYLQGNSYKDAMFDSAFDWGDITSWSYPALNAITTDLKNTPNYYLRYREERYITGVTVPKINDKARPVSGILWPRPKIVKTRRSIGNVLYPSVPPLEAPAESLLTYVGTDNIDYTTVETYINDSTGLDYSPAYLGGYIGDFTVGYTGDYLSSYTSSYLSNDSAGTAYIGTSYTGSYVTETADAPIAEYNTTYIQNEPQYTANFAANYLGDLATYTGDFVASYEGLIGYIGGTPPTSYTPGNPLGYVGTYSGPDSGGGELTTTIYLGEYAATYDGGGATAYLSDYASVDPETYLGNFTTDFTGSGVVGSYLGEYLGNFSAIYTGNYVGIGYLGTYVGASNTSLNVSNNGASNYIIDSASNPTLTLQRGTTYTFNLSVGGHPFWIKTAPNTGTGDQFNTGVTNNGAETGTLTFAPDSSAPSTLYYICQFHSGMVGTINIVTAGSTDYVSTFTGVDQENYVGDFTASFTGSYNA